MASRLRFDAAEHKYYLQLRNNGGERKVPSVTTIIAQYAKPKLVPWATNKAADYACDHWEELLALPLSERRKHIARAADYVRDDSAAAGTQIHRWAEALMNGYELQVPEGYRSTVEHLARWWESSGLVTVATEAQVFSDPDEYWTGYAGTLDVLATDTDGYHLLDFKSGGVYESAAVQLAGYAAAQSMVFEGEDAKLPTIHHLGVLQLRPDGCRLFKLDATQQARAYTWWDNALENRSVGTPRFKMGAVHV